MDFRTFVDLLDSEDELLWIRSEVDPVYELGALLKQAEARNKAICFERVKGSQFAAIGGLMSSPERHALAIARSPLRLSQPGAWSALLKDARRNPMAAVTVDSGPAADVVMQGSAVDITTLPVPRFFSGDTHKFITAGLGIVKDPVSGIQNVGFYRAPIVDQQHISISAGPSSQLNQIYTDARKNKAKLAISYVIGAPPSLLLTAGCRIGRAESDMDIAGALQGAPLDLMPAQTSDLLVPAQAEFVIEAEVDFAQQIDHTMGEFPDNYGTTSSPAARITAITHRADALFHTILGGMNREHNALGSYIFCGLRELLLEQLQPQFPCLRDIHVDLTPRRMGGRCQINVAIAKQADNEPQALMAAIYSRSFDTFPLNMIAQRIVVVDEDVNIRNDADIEWAIAMRVNTKKRISIYEATARRGSSTTRLAIDATLDPNNKSAGERPQILNAEKYPLDKYL